MGSKELAGKACHKYALVSPQFMRHLCCSYTARAALETLPTHHLTLFHVLVCTKNSSATSLTACSVTANMLWQTCDTLLLPPTAGADLARPKLHRGHHVRQCQ